MKYTKERLDEINIHSLRNLARELGVKSPTNLTKSQLIFEILSITSGNKLPHIPSKRGRPVKNGIDEKGNISQTLSLQTLKEQIKQQIISSILKELEKKLNEIL